MEETATGILIVDDTPANRKLHAAMLKDMGLRIVTAESGAEALARCREQEFAVILLDVNMPDMDGFETAERIRALPLSARTPVVFVSAVHTREADEFYGYALGAADYLISPVLPDILRAKVAVFVDLYGMRRELAEQAARLEQANRALRAANEELETFSYSASHDLRAPLRHMSGFSEILLEEYADRLDEQGKDYLRRVAAAARHMGVLIEDLLMLARITRSDMKARPVDLSDMAREIGAVLQQTAPQRRVQWVIAPTLVAHGDTGLLRVALDNLIENAWKYTSKNNEARIEFGMLAGNGTPAYFVRDNGVGFDLSRGEGRLFKPFQRMHAADEYPGTGIGLATAHRVVTRHGGRIWAESEPGKGATFCFTLA